MQKAGELAIGLLKPGFSLNFAALPAGLDPDDLIKHQGTEMMGKILGNAVSLSESLWRHELALLPQKPTPEQKAALEKRLFDIAAKIQDNNVKASYRSYFSGMLWQHIKKPRSTIMDVTNHKTANLNAVASCVISDIERLERTIILIITNYPYLLKDHRIEEEFSLLELSNYELDNLRMQILAIYNENNDINCQNISQSLEKNQFFNDITYWAKQNLSFVNYNHQEGEAANFWQYSLYKYRLSLLEIDYRNNLNQLTQSSMARADEFRKQIILLRNEINKMEHLLDT
jgi:DNA primase